MLCWAFLWGVLWPLLPRARGTAPEYVLSEMPCKHVCVRSSFCFCVWLRTLCATRFGNQVFGFFPGIFVFDFIVFWIPLNVCELEHRSFYGIPTTVEKTRAITEAAMKTNVLMADTRGSATAAHGALENNRHALGRCCCCLYRSCFLIAFAFALIFVFYNSPIITPVAVVNALGFWSSVVFFCTLVCVIMVMLARFVLSPSMITWYLR